MNDKPIDATGVVGTAPTSTQACFCVGPRPGEPRCPCLMRGLIQRDGRWIRPEQDLGPVSGVGEDVRKFWNGVSK